MAIRSLLILVVVLCVLGVSVAQMNNLDLSYYKSKCPSAEDIVRNVTEQYVSDQPSLAAALLRLHFHDCFVRGCDASILLLSPTNDTERAAIPSLSLRGYELIDAAKTAVEKKCPGLVSCADVLALVARDAVAKIDGPWWPVPLGRRDGRISRASEVNLPSPFTGVVALKESFVSKGLTTKDLIVLSGSHAIGISHCGLVNKRIYNFTGKGDTDPSMNQNYASELKKKCKPNDFNTPIDMDPGSSGGATTSTDPPLNPQLPGTSTKFDSRYFNTVAEGKGMFTSDSTLLDDPETKSYIDTQVRTDGKSFPNDFAESMVKLGVVEINTGNMGEIRQTCAFVNELQISASNRGLNINERFVLTMLLFFLFHGQVFLHWEKIVFLFI